MQTGKTINNAPYPNVNENKRKWTVSIRKFWIISSVILVFEHETLLSNDLFTVLYCNQMDLTLPNLLIGRGRPSDVSEVTYNGLTEDWTDEIIHETNKHDQLTGTYPIQNFQNFDEKKVIFRFS